MMKNIEVVRRLVDAQKKLCKVHDKAMLYTTDYPKGHRVRLAVECAIEDISMALQNISEMRKRELSTLKNRKERGV